VAACATAVVVGFTSPKKGFGESEKYFAASLDTCFAGIFPGERTSAIDRRLLKFSCTEDILFQGLIAGGPRRERRGDLLYMHALKRRLNFDFDFLRP
jgi:hypothetical protein